MVHLLRLENVTKSYPSGHERHIFPLKGVNLEIVPGERIALLGKSGSGKTTFLNILGGVDTPSAGSVFFGEREISALPAAELAEYRRREVGFIFQSFNLFSTLTVGENVTLPLDLLGRSDHDRARELLAAVGLDGMWDRFPEQLSGGEQQRAAIARALVKGPSLILADEPTGNLDGETGAMILDIIFGVSERLNATLVVATHSLEAVRSAHRVFKLKAGVLVETETHLAPGGTGTREPMVSAARGADSRK